VNRMPAPTIRAFADAEAVSRAAAAEFVRCAREAVAARGRFTVALSGGSTPKRLYQLLADPPFHDEIDWSKIEFFWGDERSVPPDHNDSNYHTAYEAMLRRLPIPPGQVHRMEAERQDRDIAARDYETVVARVFNVPVSGPPPALDLILLGMGPDGHTASLFPHTAALKETARWVVVNYVPKFATDRVTFTVPMLNKAREVLFLIAGTDKADPLHEVLEGPPNSDLYPSQFVKPSGGTLVFFVDRAAAAKLSTADGGKG
jgi:6-phosphogluconolactonase